MTSEHKSFEDALKARRTAFAEVLAKAQSEVDAFDAMGDLEGRDAHAEEAAELSARLKAAAEEAEEINGQERLLGWALTKYTQVSACLALGASCGFVQAAWPLGLQKEKQEAADGAAFSALYSSSLSSSLFGSSLRFAAVPAGGSCRCCARALYMLLSCC